MSYRMKLKTLTFLSSKEGSALLERLQEDISEENQLESLSKLREEYSPEQAAAAVDTVILRQKATEKFSKASEMFFTRDALEQASDEVVSKYRAKRFVNFTRVADLGCGIGSDSIQMARYTKVVAVDKDPLRLEMAKLNAEVCGVKEDIEFVLTDFVKEGPPDVEAIFWDPSRRKDSRRIFSIFEYEPSLEILPVLLEQMSNIGIKVSPGVSKRELTRLQPEFELEFIAKKGSLKEAVLWLGTLKTKASRRATVLPAEATMTDQFPKKKVKITKPKQYLYEPNSAIIRAGLVENLATREGFNKIDAQIAFLTGGKLIKSEFFRVWKVEEAYPFSLKQLNQRLRELDVGYVNIKTRGSPINPENFRKRLKLEGSKGKILVFTKVQNEPYMLICERVHLYQDE